MGKNYQPQLVSRISEPSTECFPWVHFLGPLELCLMFYLFFILTTVAFIQMDTPHFCALQKKLNRDPEAFKRAVCTVVVLKKNLDR